MAMEGGMKCVKYLMFLFNFLFWICGLVLIIIGVVVQIKLNKTIEMKDFSVAGPAIVIIAVGVVIFFISFFGCCGAWKENYCMVTTFAVLLSLIFLVQVAAAIAGYIYKNKVHDIIQNSFDKTMAQYNVTEFKKVIDDIQHDFHCCGSKNYTDWFNIPPFSQNHSVPDSCCKNETKNCGSDIKKINQEACVKVLDDWIKSNLPIVCGVALGIAFFQILGIVFACMLMRGIRSGYEVM
ncbi:CD63 antigen [Latimeria chalumnae]|uniref:CD63 antigen n=1 Tax=Latimeria chalumnae TaxID=7897 RepID=UPI0006D918F0|nr:PREDICTED: CD63 antigen [Latimeria chalumnae]|eukprot:XP_014341285.1 PREDICTED: CD63 antigen [Latimeria chalumnae]